MLWVRAISSGKAKVSKAKMRKQFAVNVFGQDFDVDIDNLSPEAFNYFFTYGVKQSLADAGANPKLDRNAKQIAARKRYDLILSGKVPTGGGGAGVDPVVSTFVGMLRGAKLRKNAKVAYAASDVPSSKRGLVVVYAFATKHFGEKNATVIGRHAAKVAEMKRASLITFDDDTSEESVTDESITDADADDDTSDESESEESEVA
jgi:hypothetical protein